MSLPRVRLESVRRKSGGRVHLTPRVPRSGAVTTLCGQTIANGAYAAVDADADCANCIRRSTDPSRISSAFFEQDEGSELLRLSLEQARFRKPATTARPSVVQGKPDPRSAPPPRRGPEQIGELLTADFKAAGNGVWRSPAGVVVRMGGEGKSRFAELIFEGASIATRVDLGIRLRAGDVEVNPVLGGFEVRVRRE
jgi:hypothetical protein